jgi:SAM-dependent methyltransferase
MNEANPWLQVSAADYEGHMAHPAVGQLELLADRFAAALAIAAPRRVALLGCATGNGLERVDPERVEWLLGVDINPEYLTIAGTRHRARLGARLTLRGADLGDPIAAAVALAPGGFDLIHAALLFEYLQPARLLPVLAGALAETGRLAVLLQLPATGQGAVTATPFTGVRVLEPLLTLRHPAGFAAVAEAAGLVGLGEEMLVLPTGKRFHESHWRRA